MLTVVNLFLLALLISQVNRPAIASEAMLRGRGLEIVDAKGRVRASISVMPEEKSANGSTVPETVLLRLITDRGRPAVKISTSEGGGSGMSLAGPTGTHQTYVSIGAKDTSTTLKLKNEDGKERMLTP
ncbi:MAG: hypothetical protein ACRD3G_30635 [Vicinamibacterales bacterium]